MKFDNVVGQEAVKKHLRAAIRMNKISHAYIINGEKGYGKLKLAEAFAESLLCKSLNPEIDENQITFPGMEPPAAVLPEVIEPCGECISCRKAQGRNHPDIIYISHEKPNTISVGEIREQINSTVQIKPYESKRKIYIVPEADLMNEQAQNAILKTIEEPPEFVTILLLTNNAQSLLQTVLSRCVLLNMTPVNSEEIKKYLMSQGVVDYQANMSIAFGEGNPGKALMLAMDTEFDSRKKLVIKIFQKIRGLNSIDRSSLAEELEADKDFLNEYFDLMTVFMKDVLVYKTTLIKEKLIFQDQFLLIKDIAGEITLVGINNIINEIAASRQKIRALVTPGLTLEILLKNIKENM